MGSLTRSSNFQNKIKSTNKIPEYAGEYKREWQYIRGINKTCGIFVKRLKKIDFYSPDTFFTREKNFFSGMAKSLIKDFNNVLKAQERGNF